MRAVFGAVGPGQRAVHDRIALPDAKMPQGPLARVTGAAHPVAYGALHGLALPVGHPHMELVLRSLALLKPDIAELPLVAEAHRTSRRALLASLPEHPYRTSRTQPPVGENPTV